MKHSRLLAYTFATGLLLSACGSSRDPDETSLSGDLELAVTDAEEDFLTYRIELESIQLKKNNGSLVEVLPLQTEIDFVQYQELSELFAVLSVPAGEYQSVVLSLDYSEADIVIQDESGASYQATIQDSEGNALTQIDVELSLNDSDTIKISPFKTAQLTLDLDLAASNTIESFDPPLVSVEPFMIGSSELDIDREHRVRGLLKEVDLETNTIVIDVIPMRLRRGGFGDFDLHVDDSTFYEIDGVEYKPEEGFSLLAKQAKETPLVAFGGPSEEDGVGYFATQVLVGTSVPWAEQDVLKGIITARSGNSLAIQGAVVELRNDATHFQTVLNLNVSDKTIVTGYRLGDAELSNLSVGQRVLALGEYKAETNEFDSSEGQVRMKLNAIVGEVLQASPLALDLSHINKRPTEVFDFSGTGVDAANDVNPDSYEINSSNLDISSIESQEWLQVLGYPSAFGTAPTDFDALNIINPNFSSHAARMFALWPSPSPTDMTVEAGEIILALDDAKSKLHLKGVPGSSKLELSVEKIISTAAEGRYSILIRGEGIQMYNDFASFSSAVSNNLQDGLAVHQLTATGQYSESMHSLDASYVTLRLAATAE